MQLATLIIAALALVLTIISMVVQLITLAVVFSSQHTQKQKQIEPDEDDEPTEEEINAFFGGYSVPEQKPSSKSVITPKEQRAVEEALTNVPQGIDEDFGL